MSLKLLTRNSLLAMAQALSVHEKLKKAGLKSEIISMKTAGDINLNDPLYAMNTGSDENDLKNGINKEGKAFFTKELEDALLAEKGDLAVHSLKDLPTALPDQLEFLMPLAADDPGDYLVTVEPLPEQNRSAYLNSISVGTSSLRRMALLRDSFKQIETVPVRGNLITRLRKLRDRHSGISALVLAASGMNRLLRFYRSYRHEGGSAAFFSEEIPAAVKDKLVKDFNELHEVLKTGFYIYRFDDSVFLPAVGQGILGLESRSAEHEQLSSEISALADDPDLSAVVSMQRVIMAGLEAGCHIPLGVSIEKVKAVYNAPLIYRVKVFLAEDFNPDEEKPVQARRLTRYITEDPASIVRELTSPAADVYFCGRSFNKFKTVAESLSCHHLPLIRTEDTGYKIPLPADSATVIIVSPRSAEIFTEHIERNSIDSDQLPQVIVPGEGTRQILISSIPDIPVMTLEGGNSLQCAQLALQSGSEKILWLGAEDGRREGIDFLTEKNVQVEVITTHRNIPVAPEEIQLPPAGSWLVFTSPSSAEVFLKKIAESDNKVDEYMCACIGSTTADTFYRSGHAPRVVAERADFELLAAEIAGRAPAAILNLTFKEVLNET